MSISLFLCLALALTACTASAAPTSTLYLDDRKVTVQWKDGDTFYTLGPGKRIRPLVAGYNTLESYGPVQRWGEWSRHELLALAHEATEVARSRAWRCQRLAEAPTGVPRRQTKRTWVVCPELMRTLVEAGLAVVEFPPEDAVPEDLRRLADEAQTARRGMWKRGVPAFVVGSVSSRDPDDSFAEHRLIDTRTGTLHRVRHRNRIATCAEFCATGACMTWVPRELRWGSDKATCLDEPDQVSGVEP